METIVREKIDMVLKGWLERCPPEERNGLLRFLSEGEQQHLAGLPMPEVGTTPQMKNAFEQIHWSWFVPILKTYASRDQILFLSALEPQIAEQLQATLKMKKKLESVSEMGKTYLCDVLARSLEEEGPVLPPEFLPASPLNQLATLSKQALMRLIHRLSFYDLAAEIRHIVDPKVLKKIYGFLNEEEKEFLKTVSSKTADPFPRMSGWDGSEESFRVALHRKGLVRLGAALSGQHPDLIWTICHHLDIGRGGALLKLVAKEPIHGVTEIAQTQVLELIERNS